MDMGEAVNLAWHYTVAQHAQAILRDGVIKPAMVGIVYPEKPVVWFSKNQRWEQTANKMYREDDNTITRLDRKETLRRFGGWRFSVPVAELLRWAELKDRARIKPKTVRALVDAAESMGADPHEWCGSLEPVDVTRCKIIQEWRGDDWKTISRSIAPNDKTKMGRERRDGPKLPS